MANELRNKKERKKKGTPLKRAPRRSLARHPAVFPSQAFPRLSSSHSLRYCPYPQDLWGRRATAHDTGRGGRYVNGKRRRLRPTTRCALSPQTRTDGQTDAKVSGEAGGGRRPNGISAHRPRTVQKRNYAKDPTYHGIGKKDVLGGRCGKEVQDRLTGQHVGGINGDQVDGKTPRARRRGHLTAGQGPGSPNCSLDATRSPWKSQINKLPLTWGWEFKGPRVTTRISRTSEASRLLHSDSRLSYGGQDGRTEEASHLWPRAF